MTHGGRRTFEAPSAWPPVVCASLAPSCVPGVDDAAGCVAPLFGASVREGQKVSFAATATGCTSPPDVAGFFHAGLAAAATATAASLGAAGGTSGTPATPAVFSVTALEPAAGAAGTADVVTASPGVSGAEEGAAGGAEAASGMSFDRVTSAVTPRVPFATAAQLKDGFVAADSLVFGEVEDSILR